MLFIFLWFFFTNCVFRDLLGWGSDFWSPYYTSALLSIISYWYIKKSTNHSINLISVKFGKYKFFD